MPMRPSAEYDSGDVQMVAQMSRPRLDFNARLSKLRFDWGKKRPSIPLARIFEDEEPREIIIRPR